MLVQMSVRSAWTSLTVAVTDCHTADYIFPLRSLRGTMRCNVPVDMRLTARMSLLHRLDYAWRRLCTEIESKRVQSNEKYVVRAMTPLEFVHWVTSSTRKWY